MPEVQQPLAELMSERRELQRKLKSNETKLDKVHRSLRAAYEKHQKALQKHFKTTTRTSYNIGMNNLGNEVTCVWYRCPSSLPASTLGASAGSKKVVIAMDSRFKMDSSWARMSLFIK